MQRDFRLNLALKMAMLASGKKQNRIARDAGINETLLSRIVRGRRDATDKQRAKLARVLGKRVEDLFPAAPEAVAS